MAEKLIFATGNQNKLREAREILKGHKIENAKIDLDELQGDHRSIALHKAEQAFSLIGEPVFVEDTCLIFDEFGELPGPYIKDFVKHIGVNKLPKLLCGFSNKKAHAVCTIAYKASADAEALLFEGMCEGKIVEARGKTEFAWDPIFEPEGYDKTFAELDSAEKNRISHRKRAFARFSEYLDSL